MNKQNAIFLKSIIMIAIAALLWGTDSLLLYENTFSLDPLLVVFHIHLFGALILAPIILYKVKIKKNLELKIHNKSDIISFLGVGILGAILGSTFYTSSVQNMGPSLSSVLYMFQPMVVVTLASFFLKQEKAERYLSWSFWIVLNALLINYPSYNFEPIHFENSNVLMGVSQAFLSILSWGLATIAGKKLLHHYSVLTIIFWRWSIALFFLGLAAFHKDLFTLDNWAILLRKEYSIPIISMALINGVFAMSIYYKGLKELPVSIVSFVELLFPLMTSFLTSIYFGQGPSSIQVTGLILLVFTVRFFIIPNFIIPTSAPASNSR